MSKVINKKLHPYYKTGIYGWIGEEVDDNDYIICPICGDVLGVNYCDYSAEQGYYDKCPKCKQELDYSEIYDFEDTCYFEQLLEIKESRLADLEAKLAEEKEYTQQYRKECAKIQTDYYELKQQLAELKTENMNIFEYSKEVEQQLADKEKEISVLKSQLCLSTISQSIDQDKISFAVEQLEKVKLYNRQRAYNYMPLTNYIDNQIKQLKEMK